MMIVFFDLDGIVRAVFIPRNTKVNSEYYKDLLERLRKMCIENELKMGKRFHPPSWQIPCHPSLLVWKVLSNKNITVCLHPPYSPDLAPWDFWLFTKVKIIMKGKSVESVQDIEAATIAQLKTLTKEDFQNCFRYWQERWDKCVRSEGEYFEGD